MIIKSDPEVVLFPPQSLKYWQTIVLHAMTALAAGNHYSDPECCDELNNFL